MGAERPVSGPSAECAYDAEYKSEYHEQQDKPDKDYKLEYEHFLVLKFFDMRRRP